MKQIRKYKNIGYSLAIFAYIDLFVGVSIIVGSDIWDHHQIKMQSRGFLETPDLTSGLEELDLAVERDLEEAENKKS